MVMQLLLLLLLLQSSFLMIVVVVVKVVMFITSSLADDAGQLAKLLSAISGRRCRTVAAYHFVQG